MKNDEQIITLQTELNGLEVWFNRYDVQVIQFTRDIRLNNSSNIDIAVLDAQAVIKSARIKTLREQINTLIEGNE